MAKLPKDVADRVDQAESSEFGALADGRYIGTLRSVDTSKSGPQGPYWSWEFDNLHNKDTGEKAPGRLWVNTSLSEKADWKMKEVFTALGYTPDSDTDEMCGEKCILVVSQRVIEKGTRAGEMGNNVDRCVPLEEGDVSGGSEEDSDVF